MKPEEFNKILEHRILQTRETLSVKTVEYSQNNDSLHNFRVAARVNNTSMSEALWGMSSKHLVSIIDMVKSDLKFEPAYIDEKIGDMQIYLILLEAILKEKN